MRRTMMTMAIGTAVVLPLSACNSEDNSSSGAGDPTSSAAAASTPAASSGASETATESSTGTTSTGETSNPTSTTPESTPTSQDDGGLEAVNDGTPLPATGAGLSLENLLTAPYPAMCDNPAGTLKDGQMKSSSGSVVANAPGSAYYQSMAEPMLVNLDGDAKKEAVVAFSCDAGGVTWPQHIVAYDDDWKVLGQLNLGDVAALNRPHKANVRSLSFDERLIVQIESGQTGVPDQRWYGYLSLTGGKLVLNNVTRVATGSQTGDAKPEPTPTTARGPQDPADQSAG